MSGSELRSVFLLLGSNIEPERHIPEALRRLRGLLDVPKTSSVYETDPVGIEDQPAFLNAGLLANERRAPHDLKQNVLRSVEDEFGRDRSRPRDGPRRLDVDIILYGDLIRSTERLQIPDPDLLKHPHVAIPIAELAPDHPHPITGDPLRAIADAMQRDTIRDRPDVSPGEN